jgi:glycosyltransferase involved in cell wall biosynthesis
MDFVISCIPFKHIRQNNRGSAASRNVAIRAALGDVISFIDVDDIWNKDYLKIQLSHLNSTDNPGYVICHFLSFLDEEVIGEQKEKPHWVRTEHLKNLQPGYLPSCFVVKRSVFEKVGFFDELFHYSYDMNWFLIAQDLGIPFTIEMTVLVKRRIHLNNQVRDVPQLQHYALKVIRDTLKRRR